MQNFKNGKRNKETETKLMLTSAGNSGEIENNNRPYRKLNELIMQAFIIKILNLTNNITFF